MFSPIFLASTGRSGSTATMKALSFHPQILVRSVFPYETRSAQFFYIRSQQNTKKNPLEHSGVLYRSCQGNDHHSKEWMKQELKPIAAEANINDYYGFVQELEGKPNSTHFAEKLIGLSLSKEWIRNFCSAKVIFLKRDPRDSFVSMRSFDEKRKSLAFQGDRSNAELFKSLIDYYTVASKFSTYLLGDAISLSYEALMIEPYDTLQALFKNLELAYDDALVREVLLQYDILSESEATHRTTSKSKSTIGRWKEDSDEETLKMFDNYEKELKLLGYAG